MPHLHKRLTLAVLVIGVALRTAVAARGWLYWDDLILQSKVREAGLLHSLLLPHDGHLMPAAWVIEWALTRYAPLSWPAALVVLAALQLGAAVGVAWGCRQLAGRWTPIPVALYLASPLTLPVTTWLAAGINALPLHASLAMVIGHLARGRRGDPVRAAGWLLAGLAFNERALLIAPLAILALACWGYRGRLTRAAVALIPLTAVWAGVYWALARPGDSTDGRLPLAGLLWHGYVRALLPTTAGGPWVWDRWQPSPPFAEAPLPVVLLGALVVAVVLGWSRRHWVVWVPTLVYPAAPILALWLLRSGANTAVEIVLTLRHLSEVAVLVALTLAVLQRHLPRRPPLAAAVITSSLVSSATYAQAWADQPARDYFSHLREPGLNQDVPAEVLLPVASPHNRLDHLAPWLVTDSTASPTLIDAHGERHPASLITSRTSTEGCGDTALALDGPLYNIEWTVLLNYFASAPGTAEVSLDGAPVRVDLAPGLNQVWVRVKGGGASLRVRPDVDACFGHSQVGQLAL